MLWESGWIQPYIKRDALKAGNSFIGPAIIEETGATSVVERIAIR
ncbi:MAG: hypothetical protein ACLR8P_17670 [Clostridium fessum]